MFVMADLPEIGSKCLGKGIAIRHRIVRARLLSSSYGLLHLLRGLRKHVEFVQHSGCAIDRTLALLGVDFEIRLGNAGRYGSDPKAYDFGRIGILNVEF